MYVSVPAVVSCCCACVVGIGVTLSQAVSDASLVFRHILGDRWSVVVSTGGSICQAVREFLQNVTKAEISDRYGTTEVCSNGSQLSN